MAPGPEVAMQTPTWPVNLAWPHAMKAAISSCRVWTKRSRSWCGQRAEDPVDAVPRVSVDRVDTPLDEALTQVVGSGPAHRRPPCPGR